DGAEVRRAKSLLHPANTGLVPGDHIDVHQRLTALLAPLRIEPLPNLPRVGSRSARKIKTRFDPAAIYIIELWTQSSVTRDAVLAALEHHFKLVREDDPADPSVIRFTGD